jgi:hypothetical protein
MWIGLAEAKKGRPSAERFGGLLDACRAAVEADVCSFVLSFSNYEENWRRPRFRDRMDVGTLMSDLAGLQRIATPQDVIRGEVAVALHDILHLPGPKPTYEVFGTGAAFVLGEDLISSAVASIDLPTSQPAVREWMQLQAIDVLEWAAIVGLDGDYRDLGVQQLERGRNERYVAHREELGKRMREWSRDKDRADRFAYASELLELHPIIDEVGARFGVGLADVAVLGREALTHFIAAMPMESVVHHLHRAALMEDRKWQLNDHNDVVYLSNAAAYCDVVVGERHWTSKLRAKGCPTRARHVLSSPSEFEALLHGLLEV